MTALTLGTMKYWSSKAEGSEEGREQSRDPELQESPGFCRELVGGIPRAAPLKGKGAQ